MTLITHDYYCPRLGMASEIRLLVPDTDPAGTLYLLSPEGESGLRWLTDTPLSTLAERYGTAVVLAPCLQGCYTDMAYGYPFYASLKYVREYLRSYLPGIDAGAGKCAAAGASIGGPAALRWAMEEPEVFACCGSFSGLFDPDGETPSWFDEKKKLCLWGDAARRQEISRKLWSDLESTGRGGFFISAAADDPGAGDSEKAASLLGDRCRFSRSAGRSDWKAWGDALGAFMEYWRGGADVCR